MANMLFGPIGRQVEIPCPDSGMGFDNVLQMETTDLLSGGVSVYRAPTSYKKFNLSWKGGFGVGKSLQNLIDLYQGMYGPGPYYMLDPTTLGENLLPQRWASSYQLGHISGGWCGSVITSQTNTPQGQQVSFIGTAEYTDEGPSIVIPCVPKQPLFLKAWGTRTGTAGVRVYRHSTRTRSWETTSLLVAPSLTMGAPTLLAAPSGEFDAVRLVLFVPTGSSLTLQHMDLSGTDYNGRFRSGTGVGAVQFTGNLGGTLVSKAIDRIGLSMDLTEVERDANYS